MTGGVYKIAIQGRHNNDPHPHVVVLEITGSKECVIVPAFSSGGVELNEYMQAAVARGYREELICVELDNNQCVRFTKNMTGKIATWVIERHRRIATKELVGAEKIGEMDGVGLSKIAEGMLRLAEHKPEIFSASLLKRLRQLIQPL